MKFHDYKCAIQQERIIVGLNKYNHIVKWKFIFGPQSGMGSNPTHNNKTPSIKSNFKHSKLTIWKAILKHYQNPKLSSCYRTFNEGEDLWAQTHPHFKMEIHFRSTG